ncbi:protein sorting system archaetidylserine decarboxylase [Halocalculus aciditolerans]|nr:protein sorting system archaetidylserine decarboxylase [Halocalculus aciditolerans]
MQFAPGATRYAVYALVGGFALALVSPLFGAVGLVAAGFVLWFHRDPDRTAPDEGVVSPADGRVSVVREDDDGRVRVGVFMNVTDIHVNRAPLDGFLEDVERSPGAHRPAFTKSSERNERVTYTFGRHEVVLIAGAFARRIHPYLEPGAVVERGDKLGHISFGSRADVRLPPEYTLDDVRVEKTERVTAGESVLAERDGDE